MAYAPNRLLKTGMAPTLRTLISNRHSAQSPNLPIRVLIETPCCSACVGLRVQCWVSKAAAISTTSWIKSGRFGMGVGAWGAGLKFQPVLKSVQHPGLKSCDLQAGMVGEHTVPKEGFVKDLYFKWHCKVGNH